MKTFAVRAVSDALRKKGFELSCHAEKLKISLDLNESLVGKLPSDG